MNSIEPPQRDCPLSDIQNKYFRFGLVFLPLLLWLYFYRHLFAGSLKLIVDAKVCYHYTQYYLSHIQRWIYPLWDPFHAWGRPDDFAVRMIGECNPFLYLITLLRGSGLTFSSAYFIYAFGYFLLGMLGFLLLAQRLFQRFFWGYIAFLLLLFSNIGSHLFNDYLLILMFVPTVWFFYFLIAFLQTYKRSAFLGLIYTLMITATTYMPFHFMTCLGAVFFIGLLLYPLRMIAYAKGSVLFIKKNKVIFIIGVLSLILAGSPGYLWYQAAQEGNYVVAWRSANDDPLAISLKTISASSLVGPNSLRGMWADFDMMDLGLFYVPLFFWLTCLLGGIVPVQKRSVLFLGVALILLLISLADFTPVFPFLFYSIFFFKYFRNLHYLIWFSLPFAILFCVDLLRWWLQQSQSKRSSQNMLGAYLVGVHILCGVFFIWMKNVPVSSYLTLGLNFCLFAYILKYGLTSRERPLLVLILVLIVIQPFQVFYFQKKNTEHYRFPWASKDVAASYYTPQFHWQRPARPGPDPSEEWPFGSPSDNSGFFAENYYGLKWSHYIHENVPRQVLRDYVRHKFIVYEQIECVSTEYPSASKLTGVLAFKEPKALVLCDPERERALAHFIGQTGFRVPQTLEAGEGLTVIHFDLNEIVMKTAFAQPKFLVYNDSFHKDWRVMLNGRKDTLYQANVAFKGLALPAGENEIRLTFRSPGLKAGYMFLIIYFWLFFIFLVGLTLYDQEFFRRLVPASIRGGRGEA